VIPLDGDTLGGKGFRNGRTTGGTKKKDLAGWFLITEKARKLAGARKEIESNGCFITRGCCGQGFF